MANLFDQCSNEYRRFRPSYPGSLYELLVSRCALDTRSRVLDVGAGTGKGSAPLADRGISIIAAEPSIAMIQQGQQSYRKLPYVCATAEALPFAREQFDMVMSAQSFHWFDSKKALTEFCRVLKRERFFSVFWNSRDQNVAHMQFFDNLVRRFNPEHELSYRRRDWGSVLQESGMFRIVEHREFSFNMPMTIETWIGLARSISYIRSIGEQKLAEFENALAEGMAAFSSVDAAYATHLWLAQKTDTATAD